MKRLQFLALVSASLCGVTAMLVACGDDDSTVNLAVDGGSDASIDQQTPVADTGTDTGAPDTGAPDTGTEPLDAGPDATVTQIINAFGVEIAGHMCDALTRCCYGQASVADGGVVDGGASGTHFDRGACIDSYKNVGFEGSASATQGGTLDFVVIDEAARTDCYAKLAVLSCTLGSDEMKAARASCFAALKGTIAIGAPCNNTVQCVTGSFCNRNLDAGADAGEALGLCQAVRAVGGACGDVQTTASVALDSTAAEAACSTRGDGDTGNQCASYTAVDYKADRAQWTCQPGVGNGAVCNTDVSCAAGLCNGDTFQCQPTLPYFQSACTLYAKP